MRRGQYLQRSTEGRESSIQVFHYGSAASECQNSIITSGWPAFQQRGIVLGCFAPPSTRAYLRHKALSNSLSDGIQSVGYFSAMAFDEIFESMGVTS